MIFFGTFLVAYIVLFIQQLINSDLFSSFFSIYIIGLIARLPISVLQTRYRIVIWIIIGFMCDSTQDITFGFTTMFFMFFDGLQKLFIYNDDMPSSISNRCWSFLANFLYMFLLFIMHRSAWNLSDFIIELTFSQIIILFISQYFCSLTLSIKYYIEEKINFSKKSLF